jgi:lipopolysaccharide export system permease protein
VVRLGRLRLGGRLDVYVGGLFLAAYATAFLLVVGLAVILDVASHLDYFEVWGENGERTPSLTIVRYYLLNTPFLYLEVAPFVTVVAGMFTVSRLVKYSETTAALAAGVSTQRLLLPVLLGGLVVAGGMFFLRESASVALGPRRDALLYFIENHIEDRVYEEVWFRDLRGNVVRFQEFRPAVGSPPVAEGLELEATVKVEGVPTLIRADRAVYARLGERAGWRLEGGSIERIGVTSTKRSIDLLEVVDFTPRDVLLSIKAVDRPLELSFSQIDQLAARDPDNSSYQTLLQYHLTFPLANLVLLLVALPFLVGNERGKGTEGLALGALFCLFYFALDFVARALGMEGDLPPLLASWLPVLAIGSLGIVLFDGMRT